MARSGEQPRSGTSHRGHPVSCRTWARSHLSRNPRGCHPPFRNDETPRRWAGGSCSGGWVGLGGCDSHLGVAAPVGLIEGDGLESLIDHLPLVDHRKGIPCPLDVIDLGDIQRFLSRCD